MYKCACTHTHTLLTTYCIYTGMHTQYWQENNIHRYSIQKFITDQSEDNFHMSNNFYLPKSSGGLHINAKTKKD